MSNRAACALLAWLSIFAAGCGDGRKTSGTNTAKSAEPARVAPVEPKKAEAVLTPSLSLLTYNIDAHGPNLKDRHQAILEILRGIKADIMAFQEADPEFVNTLGEEPWIKEAYRLTKLKGEGTAVRGVILCSRIHVEKWEYRVLPGKQARAAVLIHITLNGQKFLVASTHLESPLEDAPTRVEQLKMIFERLNEPDGAVLMADFNFGDGTSAESDALDKRYIDPWPVLKSGQPGFTWDNEQNAQAKQGAFAGETSRRLDRILVRSAHLKPKSVQLIGDKPLRAEKPEEYPSDHFGVFAKFDWE